jgi:hypothetical protein
MSSTTHAADSTVLQWTHCLTVTRFLARPVFHQCMTAYTTIELVRHLAAFFETIQKLNEVYN